MTLLRLRLHGIILIMTRLIRNKNTIRSFQAEIDVELGHNSFLNRLKWLGINERVDNTPKKSFSGNIPHLRRYLIQRR